MTPRLTVFLPAEAAISRRSSWLVILSFVSAGVRWTAESRRRQWSAASSAATWPPSSRRPAAVLPPSSRRSAAVQPLQLDRPPPPPTAEPRRRRNSTLGDTKPPLIDADLIVRKRFRLNLRCERPGVEKALCVWDGGWRLSGREHTDIRIVRTLHTHTPTYTVGS